MCKVITSSYEVEQHAQINYIFTDIFFSNFRLRQADPDGIYLLYVKPLSYEIAGAPADAIEFVRFVCYPSAHLNLWKHSRRIASIDNGHITARFKGSFQSLTVKDANNQIFSIGYESLVSETKGGYDTFMDLVTTILPLPMLVIVSDKFSGLKRRVVSTNAAAEVAHGAFENLSYTASDISARRREKDEALADAYVKLDEINEVRSRFEQSRLLPSVDPNQLEALRQSVLSAEITYEAALTRYTKAVSALPDDAPPTDGLVWQLCAIHAARNCGITGDEGKCFAVEAAKAPTLESRDDFIDKLRTAVGDTKANKFLSRVCDWSVADKFIKTSVETFTDIVTTNNSEQSNNVELEMRASGPISGNKMWLLRHANYLNTRHALAESLSAPSISSPIMPRVRKIIEDQADNANRYFRVSVIEFSYNRGVLRCNLNPRDATSTGNIYQVCVDANESSYLKASECTCKCTRAKGFPCPHTSLVLVNIRHVLEQHLGKRVPQDMDLMKFSYIRDIFYHSCHMLAQYKLHPSQSACMPEVEGNLQRYFLAPPFRQFSSMRQAKDRLKKRKKQKTGDSDTPRTPQPATSLATNLARNGELVAPGPIVEQLVNQGNIKKTIVCTQCKLVGHNSRYCTNGTTATRLASMPETLKLLLSCPLAPLNVLASLQTHRTLPHEIPSLYDCTIDTFPEGDDATDCSSETSESLHSDTDDDLNRGEEANVSISAGTSSSTGAGVNISSHPTAPATGEETKLSVGDHVMMTKEATTRHYGKRSRTRDIPRGIVKAISAKLLTVQWNEAPISGEHYGKLTFTVQFKDVIHMMQP